MLTQDRLLQLLHSTREAIWVIDPVTFGAEFTNEAFSHVFGFDPEEARTKSIQEVIHGMIHPDDLDQVQELMASMPTLSSYDHEFRIVKRTGEVRWIRSRAKAIFDSENKNPRFAGISEDITDRKTVELELRQALAEIKTLHGLIPVCSWCRKLRDGDDEWVPLETFLRNSTEAQCTHGICPECYANEMEKLDETFIQRTVA